jgi:hypothetical protein
LRFALNDNDPYLARSLDSFRSLFLYENSLQLHIAYILFVSGFAIADVPDSQSAGGGEESVQAKAAGATLHLQAGGPLEGRRKIREKSERLRGITSRTFIQKELLLKIIKM